MIRTHGTQFYNGTIGWRHADLYIEIGRKNRCRTIQFTPHPDYASFGKAEIINQATFIAFGRFSAVSSLVNHG